jgi:hypothetical protein
MPIEFQEISDGLRRIVITGRLDIPGTAEIETRFAAFSAASNLRVVLDLTGVNFLGSIGIRSIIIKVFANAKGLKPSMGRTRLAFHFWCSSDHCNEMPSRWSNALLSGCTSLAVLGLAAETTM